MKQYRTWGLASLLLGLSALGSSAHGAFIQEFQGNDCAGLFGTPPDCVVPAFPDDGILDPTPLILKIDFTNAGAISALTFGNFASIDGSEFTFDFGTGGTGTGTWFYNPGEDDPSISAYVAKGGPNFNLFSNDGDALSGDYFTPLNPGGNRAGLSHITFYDTEFTPPVVPVPATLALVALGMLGLGWSQRRKERR